MLSNNDGLISSNLGRDETSEIETIEFPYMIKLGRDSKGIMTTMTFFKARDIESDAIYHRKIITEQESMIKGLRERKAVLVEIIGKKLGLL